MRVAAVVVVVRRCQMTQVRTRAVCVVRGVRSRVHRYHASSATQNQKTDTRPPGGGGRIAPVLLALRVVVVPLLPFTVRASGVVGGGAFLGQGDCARGHEIS